MSQVHFRGESIDLNALTGSQLVELHNQAASITGTRPVNKFADKATALKRVMREVNEAAKKSPPSVPAKTNGTRKMRGMRFVFPQLDTLRPIRKNTNRAKIVDLMLREDGATFDECLAATWGKNKEMTEEIQRKTTYEAIRLIHYYSGYGMRQDAEGRISLFFTAKK